MKVADVMSRDVATCSVEDVLSVPAQLMWERTIGSVVVLSGEQLAGIVTDRDIAMSAQTQGKSLREIPVRTAMAGEAVACGPDEKVGDVRKRMVQRQVQRCPVVDGDGKVVGLLSLDDLGRLTAHGRRRASAIAGQVEAGARRAWSQVRRTWNELEQDVPGRNRAERIGSRLVRALSRPRVIIRRHGEAESGKGEGPVPPAR